MGTNNLELMSIIGFDGFVVSGLRVHPNGMHILYPLGNKVCIQDWCSKQQCFLSGHTDAISAVAVSPNGQYVAAGQVNYMGFKAIVIVWDFNTHMIIAKHEFHKVRVESITFSLCSRYVISLGGRDDCNVAVWDVQEKQAVGGNAASAGTGGDALVLCHCNQRSLCFVSGGDNTLRVWRFDPNQRMVCGMDVKIGKIKRTITCLAIDCKDQFLYCGTTTGDILKVNLNFHVNTGIVDPRSPPSMLGSYGKIPKKKIRGEVTTLYSLGVTAIVLLPNNPNCFFIVAAGDGTVEMVRERVVPYDFPYNRLRLPSIPRIDTVKTTKLDAGVTSMELMCNQLIVGTKNCEIFTINLDTFHVHLHITCHTHTVYDVAFPHDFSGVFATCSKNDIRVWKSDTSKEMLRISVPNFTCSCVIFSHNGKAIISGWNDGVIRSFTPQTGRLMFALHNAHGKGVSALRITKDDRKIVSGGVEGEVRIWDIKPSVQTLLGVLKEHKGPVSSVEISACQTEAISSSSDGTCIIWDLCRMLRSLVVFRDTQFTSAIFFPTGVQFLSVGTDRKIGFWEVLDGSLIRELEGSTTEALNTVDIAHSGSVFITGGCDQVVKLWRYNEGIVTHIGIGHAGAITAAKFSPDDQFIVTVSADGGIFRWRSPCVDCPCNPSCCVGQCSMTPKKIVNERGDSKQEGKEDIHKIRECTLLSKASHRSDAGKCGGTGMSSQASKCSKLVPLKVKCIHS